VIRKEDENCIDAKGERVMRMKNGWRNSNQFSLTGFGGFLSWRMFDIIEV